MAEDAGAEDAGAEGPADDTADDLEGPPWPLDPPDPPDPTDNGPAAEEGDEAGAVDPHPATVRQMAPATATNNRALCSLLLVSDGVNIGADANGTV